MALPIDNKEDLKLDQPPYNTELQPLYNEQFIASLDGNTVLNLKDQQLSDEMMPYLINFLLDNSQVKSVDLTNNKLNDRSAKHLSLANQYITSACLDNNNIGPKSSVALARFNGGIETLCLNHNPLGDEGIKKLIEHNQIIKRLELVDTKSTPELIAWLNNREDFGMLELVVMAKDDATSEKCVLIKKGKTKFVVDKKMMQSFTKFTVVEEEKMSKEESTFLSAKKNTSPKLDKFDEAIKNLLDKAQARREKKQLDMISYGYIKEEAKILSDALHDEQLSPSQKQAKFDWYRHQSQTSKLANKLSHSAWLPILLGAVIGAAIGAAIGLILLSSLAAEFVEIGAAAGAGVGGIAATLTSHFFAPRVCKAEYQKVLETATVACKA